MENTPYFSYTSLKKDNLRGAFSMSVELNEKEEFEAFTKELERQINTSKIHDLAKEAGFVQRNTKFKPEEFFQLCSFVGISIGKKTLTELCGKLSSLFNLSISTEGLNQRFNTQGTEFLQKIFLNHYLCNICQILILL